MEKKFSISEAFKFGWKVMKKNFGFFLVCMLLFIVINPGFGGGYHSGLSTTTGTTLGLHGAIAGLLIFLGLVVAIVGLIVSLLIQMGFLKAILLLAEDKEVTWKEVSKVSKLFMSYLAGLLLHVFITMIGLALLIIPGIIWATRFQFVTYLVIDKEMDAISALKKSWAMTRGETLHLIGFLLASIGLNIVGFLCLIVGLFATIPTTLVARAHIYRKLL